ncbi:hypothetical protein ScPMuIL_010909 [Solemya velum]
MSYDQIISGISKGEDNAKMCRFIHGGYLVEITSEDENTFVGKLIKTHVTQMLSWIGARRGRYDNWSWMHTGRDVTYTDWAKEERPSWSCAGIIYSTWGAYWAPLLCRVYYVGYVCERPVSEPM